MRIVSLSQLMGWQAIGSLRPLTPNSANAMYVVARRLTFFSHTTHVRRQLMGLWESEGVQGQWDGCSQAKKRKAHAARASMTDFDRFQVQLAKTERSAKRQKA